jgi:hypothetical protein
VIELSIPKDRWLRMELLEAEAKDFEIAKLLHTTETTRILLKKLNETRIIKIKGKNVDDLDLENYRS